MVHLVTGAAGFIGSHLTERLLARGDRVIGVDNFDPFYARTVKERNLVGARSSERFQLAQVDLCDADAVERLVRANEPDSVIHLAAKAGVRPSIENPRAYFDANVGGTLNLLLAMRARPPRHFVFASSSSVYGNAARPPFREDDRTDRPESPYGASKKAGEAVCFTYHQLLKMPVTCLRFFTVFGPRQRPDLAIHKFTRLIDAGEPVPFFGDGSTSRDYTYVEDTVDGIVAAVDRPGTFEVHNLGRSDPVTLSELVATIERSLGKRARLDHMPEQAGDVRMTCADVASARDRLGYAPRVDFATGIDRFVAWWREQRVAERL